MRPSPFAPEKLPAQNDSSGEFIREESGIRSAPTGPSGKKPDLASLYKRFDAWGKKDADAKQARDLEAKNKFERWHSPRTSPPPLPLAYQSPIERETGTTVFARNEPHRRVMPPLPLAPRFPGEDQHGQTTYVRGHAQQFSYAPEADPVTNPVEDTQAPWSLKGNIDDKTQKFFQGTRREYGEGDYMRNLIHEATVDFERAERAMANAKMSLERVTKLARSLDKGKRRLDLDANTEELDNSLLQDL